MLNTQGKFLITCITLSTTILLSIAPSIKVDATDIAVENLADVNMTKSDWTPTSGGNVTDDFKNSDKNELGYAANFHIFAKKANLSTHTNGNLAVANLSGDAGFGTNIKDDQGTVETDVSYIQNVSKIESSSFVSSNGTRKNKVTFGTDNDVLLADNDELMVNKSTIGHLAKEEVFQDQGSNTYIDFNSYFNVLAQKSQAITKRASHDKLNDQNFAEDINNRVIELGDYSPNESNKLTFDLDSSMLEKNTPLKIKGLSSEAGGTNVIINVDLSGKTNYDINSQIQLFYTDGNSTDPTNRPNHETEYFDDNHLLWNFYDSSQADGVYRGTITVDAPFQGSVMATGSTITINHNLDGNIIAEVVNVKGETHRWDYQNDDSYIETPLDKDPEPDTDSNEDLDEDSNEDVDTNSNEDSDNDSDTDSSENPDEDLDTDLDEDSDTNSNEELDEDSNEDVDTDSSEEFNESSDEDSDIDPDQKVETDSKLDQNEELPVTNSATESNFEQVLYPKATNSLSSKKLSPLVFGSVQNDTPLTSSKTKSSSGIFPSTGSKNGLIISTLGVLLLVALSVFKFKKNR